MLINIFVHGIQSLGYGLAFMVDDEFLQGFGKELASRNSHGLSDFFCIGI